MFGERIDEGRREAPPVVARYVIDGGQAFILDRTSNRPLLRFENSPEVWVLEPVQGPRGDTIFKNDLGQQMLRSTKVGGLTIFTRERPSGSAAALAGPSQPLRLVVMGPEQLFQRVAQASLRASRAAQRLIVMEAEGSPVSAALIADAAAVTAEAVVRMSGRPDGRWLLSHITKIVFDEGAAPSVSLRRGVLIVVITPPMGLAGRPSSDRIVATVAAASVPPNAATLNRPARP